MNRQQLETLATRFFTAIPAGDGATIEDCYGAGMTIWHNYDGLTQSRADNLKTLRWLARTITNYRYTDIHRTYFDNGFVQQHVLRGTVRGVDINAPVCIIAHVVDGRIAQMFEYIDAAHIAPLL